MDPASLTIGSLSFGVQLFNSSLKLWELYSEFRDAGKTATTYQILLGIQLHRFQNWGELVGLGKGAFLPQLKRSTKDLMVDVLAQIAAILCGVSKDKCLILDNNRVPAQPNNIANSSLHSALIAQWRRVHEQIAEEVKSRGVIFNTKFALWGRSKFGALIADLEKLINSLEGFTPYEKKLKGMLFSRLLEGMSVEGFSEGKSVEGIPEGKPVEGFSELSEATQSTVANLSELAKRKATFIEMRNRGSQTRYKRLNTTVSDVPNLVNSDIAIGTQPISGRQFAIYQGSKPVMLEWKVATEGMTVDKMLMRTCDVARFLSPQTNAQNTSTSAHLLPCVGYFRRPGETDKIALVYETSAGLHRPLLEIHQKSQIPLFQSWDAGLTRLDWISYARYQKWLKLIPMPNSITTSIISARARVAPGSSVGYDIYSLGVVLLEIGLWGPVEKVGKYDPKTYDATKFATKLQGEKLLDILNFTVGSAYRRAVEWCLKGPFEEDVQIPFKDLESETQSMDFWDNVVLELAKCSVPE